MGKMVAPKTEDLTDLLNRFHSKDGLKRADARAQVIRRGRLAVPALISVLQDQDKHVRWEAAKALGKIKEPSSAPALVDRLTDDSPEIRWLAAEGLIALGRDCLQPLFERLVDDFNSAMYRQGVHHVLHALERAGQLTPQEMKVLNVLRGIETEDEIAPETYKALEAL